MDQGKDGHHAPTYLLLATYPGSQDIDAYALQPPKRPSHPIWGAGSAPGWTLVGWANYTPVPTMSKTALACSEGWKAGILAWEETFLKGFTEFGTCMSTEV